MRVLAAVLALGLAGGAGAECFSAPDRLPAAIVYDNGGRIELLGRQGDVWHYRSLIPGKPAQIVGVSHGGLAVVSHSASGEWRTNSWHDPIPDAAELKTKGKATVSGTMRSSDGKAIPIAMQLVWIGDEPFELDGCTYPAITFRRILSFDGKIVSDAQLILSQTFGMTFMNVTTAPGRKIPYVARAILLE